MSDLPKWADLTDADKGAALLHDYYRGVHGGKEAVDSFPVRYADHTALLALDGDDACGHAADVVREWKDSDGWTDREDKRLFALGYYPAG